MITKDQVGTNKWVNGKRILLTNKQKEDTAAEQNARAVVRGPKDAVQERESKIHAKAQDTAYRQAEQQLIDGGKIERA